MKAHIDGHYHFMRCASVCDPDNACTCTEIVNDLVTRALSDRRERELEAGDGSVHSRDRVPPSRETKFDARAVAARIRAASERVAAREALEGQLNSAYWCKAGGAYRKLAEERISLAETEGREFHGFEGDDS